MLNKKLLFIFTAAILLVCSVISGCGLNYSQGYLHQNDPILYMNSIGQSPKDIFLQAWFNIKDQYVDETYNNQDWSKWKHRYIDKIKTKDDAYLAIETMIESLDDPYTRFLSPYDFSEQNRNIDAKLFGIGVHIGSINNNPTIIHVIEDTPAQKAGLKTGDVILKANDISLKGKELKEIVNYIRGKAGTKVILTLKRGKTILVKPVLRQEINIKSVDYKMLKNNISYIRISSFISNETAYEMIKALKATKNAKGIIIDLRGNQGGLLPNAVFIANMFINHGNIVSMVDRNGKKKDIDAIPTDSVINAPVVILINKASASASEILSGALRDHKRAVLVGETTFGKGKVQKILKLSDGSGINLTIAKYLTPNGTDIDKKGIKPDYTVKYTEKDFFSKKDPQLAKAEEVVLKEYNKAHQIVALRSNASAVKN